VLSLHHTAVPSLLVSAARLLVDLAAAYVAIGLLFAPWFVWRGVGRIDPHAQDATLGFRLIIAPGAVALWPLLLGRLLSGRTAPPEERNAHRALARWGPDLEVPRR
jgi:hypothetical protein